MIFDCWHLSGIPLFPTNSVAFCSLYYSVTEEIRNAMSIKHPFIHFKWWKGEIPATWYELCKPGTRWRMIWFFFISWQPIIKLIRSKSLFLWYTFTFNVVITHEIITFQDICMDKIPKDFTSIKDTYYAALKDVPRANNNCIYVKAQGHIFTTCPVWWI